MNPMPEITPMLKELRLSGVMDSLEQRNRQAIEDRVIENEERAKHRRDSGQHDRLRAYRS